MKKMSFSKLSQECKLALLEYCHWAEDMSEVEEFLQERFVLPGRGDS